MVRYIHRAYGGVNLKVASAHRQRSSRSPRARGKLVMVGAAPVPDVTVNPDPLVTEPIGDVTLIVPVVAPEETVATIWVAEADTTVAAVPLK